MPKSHPDRRRAIRQRRLHFEQLEDRRLMSTVVDSQPPYVAGNDGFTIQRNAPPIELNVLESDYHPVRHGLRLSVVDVTAPEHGSTEISANGRDIRYTVAHGFLGIDRFSYTVTDADGNRQHADVFVNVVEPLFAMKDWFHVEENASDQRLAVLTNDRVNVRLWPHDPHLRIIAVEPPNHGGAVSITDDGQHVLYAPAAGFEGLESFSYTVENPEGYQATADAQVQVTTSTDPRVTWKEQLALRVQQSLAELPHFGGFQGPIIYPSVSSDGIPSVTPKQEKLEEVMKAEGAYVYVLSNRREENGLLVHELVVVDVHDRDDQQIVSRYRFEEELVDLYVHGDRVTIISQSDSAVHVTRLDISDRALPTFISRSTLAGELKHSQEVGDQLLVVVDAGNTARLSMPDLTCYRKSERGIFHSAGCFYETRREYFAKQTNFFDNVFRFERHGQDNKLVEQRALLEDSELLDLSEPFFPDSSLEFSALVTFSLTSDEAGPTSSTVLAHGLAGDFRVSGNAIYLFHGGNTATSRIDKFSLTEIGRMEWAASGLAKGAVLMDLFVDEHDHLHVAMSMKPSHRSPTADYESYSYELEQIEDQLKVVEQTEGLRLPRPFIITCGSGSEVNGIDVFELLRHIERPPQPSITVATTPVEPIDVHEPKLVGTEPAPVAIPPAETHALSSESEQISESDTADTPVEAARVDDRMFVWQATVEAEPRTIDRRQVIVGDEAIEAILREEKNAWRIVADASLLYDSVEGTYLPEMARDQQENTPLDEAMRELFGPEGISREA